MDNSDMRFLNQGHPLSCPSQHMVVGARDVRRHMHFNWRLSNFHRTATIGPIL